MERRKFTREFKVEAVKSIQERGVAEVQAARDGGGASRAGFGRAWDCVAPMHRRFFRARGR